MLEVRSMPNADMFQIYLSAPTWATHMKVHNPAAVSYASPSTPSGLRSILFDGMVPVHRKVAVALDGCGFDIDKVEDALVSTKITCDERSAIAYSEKICIECGAVFSCAPSFHSPGCFAAEVIRVCSAARLKAEREAANE